MVGQFDQAGPSLVGPSPNSNFSQWGAKQSLGRTTHIPGFALAACLKATQGGTVNLSLDAWHASVGDT